MLSTMPQLGEVPLLVRLSDEGRKLLELLARGSGMEQDDYLDELLRNAARRSGLAVTNEEAPSLLLESTEEVPAIGPEGKGRKIHLKGIDETGEWDAGEIFVPDPPKR